MPNILNVHTLTKKYTPQAGVEDLSFSISEGEVLAYLGHNGAGKTTTIRALLGLLKSDSCKIEYFGTMYNPYANDFDAVRIQIGVCLENPGFYANLSALKNLALFAKLYGMTDRDFLSRSEELLGIMELQSVRDHKVKTFSKGMCQKLALIRALLHRPRLVFLDEPMTALDPVARVSVRKTISRLAKQEGVSFFLASHDLGEVEQISDSIIILEKGKIKLAGKLTNLQNASAGFNYVCSTAKPIPIETLTALCVMLGITATHISSTTIAMSSETPLSLARATASFEEAGSELLSIRKEERTLEQIYLDSLANNEHTH